MKRIYTLIIASAFCSAVTTVSATTMFFDFGDSNQPSAASNYNDVVMNGNPQPIVFANTIDSTGIATGIGLTVSGFFPGSNQNGTTTPGGAAGSTFIATATRDNAFTHVSSFGGQTTNPTGLLVFTGLDNSAAYNFTFFGSRTGVTDNRETKYTVTGSNSNFALLNTSNNTDTTVDVTSIFPAAGSISITVEAGPNNNNGTTKFAYLGALRVERVIPEPSTVGLLAATSLGMFFRRRIVS